MVGSEVGKPRGTEPRDSGDFSNRTAQRSGSGRSSGRIRGDRLVGLGRHTRHGSHSVSLSVKNTVGRRFREPRYYHHRGVRQDSQRVAGRTASRDRERRSGVRSAYPFARAHQRRHCSWHRRIDVSATGGGVRGDHTVQFSGHDPVLVFALRYRLRKHGGLQAVGKGATDHATDCRAA